MLTKKDKRERILFILNKINITNTNDSVNHTHHNIISIDEHSTDLTRKSLNYLPEHEYHNNNNIQDISDIPLMMMTAAISKPTDTFDGKVTILYGDDFLARRN